MNISKHIRNKSKFKSLSTDNPPFFQPKLTINQPNDIYEQEADAMADKVMRMPSNKNANTFFKPAAISSIQRKCDHCEEEEKQLHRKENSSRDSSGAPAIVHDVLNSSNGKKLDAGIRSFFEPRFGYDFSDVKIHNDSVAVKSAQSINALAYTAGDNIVFNQNQFSPETDTGKRLLAHELTHVVQQKSGVTNRAIQRSFWGTLGGVLGGAAIGFLTGGPAGAVAGGIIGGIAGDAVTTHKRHLNQNELIEAQKVFGNTLDYSKVSVSDSSALMSVGGYARTPFDTVYFPSGTLGRSDKGYYAFLIHELTHTWQSQHGTSVFTKIRYSLSSSNYDFGGDAGLEKAANDGKCFNDFNTEAQASILEHYYEIREGVRSGNISIYEYFLFQVQYLAGRCRVLIPGPKNDMLDERYRRKNVSESRFA